MDGIYPVVLMGGLKRGWWFKIHAMYGCSRYTGLTEMGKRCTYRISLVSHPFDLSCL